VHGGLSEGQFPAYVQAMEHPTTGELAGGVSSELSETKSHITRTLAQFDPTDRLAVNAPGSAFNTADIGDVVASYRRVNAGSLSGVGLYRRRGCTQFDARALRIAHIVLTEVPWLHESGWPKNHLEEKELPRLSRRERTVMLSLIHGAGRVEIADGLKISEHTLNDYIKRIYRHVGVSSRAQLVRRFTEGDGGDRE
jgi:DNA-binding CsgD family transcriptional regulator